MGIAFLNSFITHELARDNTSSCLCLVGTQIGACDRVVTALNRDGDV